jgi:hypothetical protein
MTKTRQHGFIDHRFAVAVLAAALVASLAIAAETGLKPAASAPIEDIDPPLYVLPDARTVPFADMLLRD